MENTDNKEMVKTTRISLEILDRIYKNGGSSINQLSQDLAMANSTVHRHLVTLEQYGYVQRYGNTFQLGLKFLDLSDYVRSQWPLVAINDVVSVLSKKTEEEIDFFTIDRGRLISLESHHRKYHKKLKYEKEEVGEYQSSYYYMHAMAAGKAILAEYPQSRVEQIVERWGLPANTKNTITSKADLFEEIETTRERGYAIDDEEHALGLRTVGKVVHNPNGGVFGALNVAGPQYRMEGVVLDEEIPDALESATAELEAAIANRGSIVREQPLRTE